MLLSEAKTQIIKDFPGRFVLESDQIKFLVREMKDALYPSNNEQTSQTRFIFGLQNGIVIQTNDINELLDQENTRQQRIIFLFIVVELLGVDNQMIRRYLIHFGLGENNLSENILEFPDRNWFNLKFEGISYRILDTNRLIAMDMMNKFNNRIPEFFRPYSKLGNIGINLKNVLFGFFFWYAYGFLVYVSSHIERRATGFTVFPEFSYTFLTMVAFSTLIGVSVLTILISIIKGFTWILPPSYFAIGQGKKAYQQKLDDWRQFIWAVPVAIAVSVLVGFLGF